MSTSTNTVIRIEATPYEVLGRRGTSRLDSPTPPETRPEAASPGITLVQYHPDFIRVFGLGLRHALLLSSAESSRNPFFHAGCAYVVEQATAAPQQEEEVLYATSNLLQSTSSSQLPIILISRIILRRDSTGDVTSVEWSKLRPPPSMPMPAGAIPYNIGSAAASSSPPSSILYCAQGNPNPGTSGLFYMPRGKPPRPLVTSYFGRDFNSVHDVACSPADGSLWFTDPCHGFEQDFRKKPQLPCHVYRFDPVSGGLRVVADDLQRPTGICLSPDAKTVYVTDTDAEHGDGNQDFTRSATIYAYDVIRRGGSEFLTSKRVFAYPLRGVPIGIKCDPSGNVFTGCADGVEVWNAGGVLLGVMEVPGGVTSFCFAREGEMFLCSEQQLWWVHYKPLLETSRWETSDLLASQGNDSI